MSITFACGHCGKIFTLDEKYAGKKGKCSQCGALLLIHSAGPDEPPAAPREREVSSSSRAREPVPPAEIPKRRVPAPTARSSEPKADVYGFDDQPLPPRSAVTELEEEDFDTTHVNTLGPRSDGLYDPPKKKKKRKSSGDNAVASTLWTVAKVALGLFVGLTVFVVVIAAMKGNWLPNIQSSSSMEAILKERVALHNSLADRLAQVNSVAEAQEASTVANQGIRSIIKNLIKLKTTKGLQKDIDILKERYATPQTNAVLRLVNELLRLKQTAEVWDALNVQAAIDEMTAEETSAPGMQQIQIPGQMNPAAPAAGFNPPIPPGFNPPTPPGFNPPGPQGPNSGFNNRPRPGNSRGGSGRMGPGGRPGQIGPR